MQSLASKRVCAGVDGSIYRPFMPGIPKLDHHVSIDVRHILSADGHIGDTSGAVNGHGRTKNARLKIPVRLLSINFSR